MISTDTHVGERLGEFQIERQLGQSRLGAAYLARHVSQGRPVMLTVFHFSEEIPAQKHEQFAARLADERAALTRLTHPHILPIYDFGAQPGYLYQAVALSSGSSPARLLKQQGRLRPEQVLDILKQVAAGLDYAHARGVVHGLLSLSNILIDEHGAVQIAGFGLCTMLEACGNRQDRQPQGYLFSTNGIFLGMPTYISPERVQGKSIDARSDIYALGVILFELLTGSLPFSGDTALDVALQRLRQPAPSLHTKCPDLPEALELVISKMLNPDPVRRYERAGDVAAAFARILQLWQQVEPGPVPRSGRLEPGPQVTLPPTINWLDEAKRPSARSQVKLPPMPGSMPATLAKSDADSLAGFDPFAWWAATSASSPASQAPRKLSTGKSPVRSAVRLKSNTRGKSRSRSQAVQQDRRRIVGLIATGAVTAGIMSVGGISFAHFIASIKQSQTQTAYVPATGNPAPATSTPMQGKTPTTATTQGTHKAPTPTKSSTPKPSPSATKPPQPSPTPRPTQPPTPTPTPPSHTGKVIGYTSQQINSATQFTNPADGQGSLLVHLTNGNFVACERHCTHEGVPVNYDPGQGKLVCPAHGAVFDPFNGFNHISGPGNGPLAGVSIRINKDGTITTG